MMFHEHSIRHSVACIWCFSTVIESDEEISPEVHNSAVDAHMYVCTKRRDMVAWTTVLPYTPTLPVEVMIPSLFERTFGDANSTD